VAGQSGALARLDRLSRGANRVAETAMAVLLAAMAVLVGVQVAGRFLFAYSLPWSDELARLLLVWISFLGISVAARRGAHPGVETIVRLLPAGGARPAGRVAWLLSLAFVVLVLTAGAELAMRTWAQRSPSLSLRMTWAYLAVPVSAALVFLHWAALGRTQVDSAGTGGGDV
jgi:TRAP-type C4-dicarboxylate transport system permease small subunit